MAFNLPPGVTLKDIDPPDDTCPECEGEGSFEESACCGANLLGDGSDICAACHEHCERAECVACDGKGRVEENRNNEIAESLASEYNE